MRNLKQRKFYEQTITLLCNKLMIINTVIKQRRIGKYKVMKDSKVIQKKN